MTETTTPTTPADQRRSGTRILVIDNYDSFVYTLVGYLRELDEQYVTERRTGKCIARLYDDDKGPKYLNTPETALYHKNQVLYGLDLAKKDIAKTKRVVIVEGYTDVMAAHLAGVTQAVATCGTAFGPEHVKIVRRLLGDDPTGQVIFTFDGDAAGQKAALRAFELKASSPLRPSSPSNPMGSTPRSADAEGRWGPARAHRRSKAALRVRHHHRNLSLRPRLGRRSDRSSQGQRRGAR